MTAEFINGSIFSGQEPLIYFVTFMSILFFYAQYNLQKKKIKIVLLLMYNVTVQCKE